MAMTATEPVSTASQVRGRYLYAIVDGGGDREALGFEGVDGGEVYSLGDGRVSAVVSDLPDRKVRPERRKLAAHHEVLKKLMAGRTVLPMAFGLIADGPDSVRRILRLNSLVFAEQLLRLEGKVEMGLRISWDVPNIFEYALSVHPELAAVRDHIFRGGREPSQDDKIEVGRTFDRLMTQDREEHSEQVTEILEAHCAEIRTNKIRNEREVLNLACLVENDRMKDFEAGVIEAARSFDNHFAFDFNGPWPPHNFVEIELRMS
jgi:Gas vesicle synthesis protein GvpL/GvpF